MRRRVRASELVALTVILGAAVLYWSRPGAPAVTIDETNGADRP